MSICLSVCLSVLADNINAFSDSFVSCFWVNNDDYGLWFMIFIIISYILYFTLADYKIMVQTDSYSKDFGFRFM